MNIKRLTMPINIKNKSQCCGCTACASICTHHCITMAEDAEGFMYPSVNLSKCSDCGLCEKVCPMIHSESTNHIIKVIGAKHLQKEVRETSSSGGLFTLLAEAFIDQGGVVVGCCLNKDLKAVHVIASCKEELVGMRSSKYVQSDLSDIFSKVRSLLRSGKKVMFSGTPCQVAGLHRFLIKPYDNLFSIDLLCHGVPSPRLYREYLSRMQSIYESKAVHVNFRSKQKGWKRLYMNIRFSNGREYFKFSGYDYYMSLFLNNKSQRNSCFHCPFNTINRSGDISLGDFWGIGKKFPEFDDDKGISLALINNAEGMNLFETIKNKLVYFESSINLAIAGNKVLVQHITGEEKRNAFYQDFLTLGLEKALTKNVKIPSLGIQLYYSFMREVLDLYRKVLKKGY